ncbi:hypothetical protein [Candidatus Poriferisocius sp.]|uniref:hypothetical protein n=1 Tax=Candidatus Poriferisocius sp. TaxID=3101276 RepID=UPI003B01D40E
MLGLSGPGFWKGVFVSGIEQDALLVLDELLDVLVERVRSEGVELLGPGGLLSQVTKAVLGAFVG